MKAGGVGPAPGTPLRDRAAKEPRLSSLPPKSAAGGSEGGQGLWLTPRAPPSFPGGRETRRGAGPTPVGGMEVSLPRAWG